MYKIKTNIPEKIKELQRFSLTLGTKLMKEGMFLLLQTVANKSTMNWWVQTSGIEESITKPVNDKKLTMRTGRLIGSVAGSLRFSIIKLPSSVKKYQKEGVKVIQKFPEGKNESIRRVILSGSVVEGIIGTTVPYGKFHEEGTKLFHARPFLKPAAKTAKQDALKIFKGIIEGTWDYDMKRSMN